MKRLILALLASAAASPALAQHGSHAQPAPASTCTPEHAAMGHCTMPAPAPTRTPAATCTPEHAAMGHCALPAEAPAAPPMPRPAPASTCTPEHAATGHCQMPPARPAPSAAPPATCTPEHAAMGHCALPAATPAPPQAQTPTATCTPEHAAMGHCTPSTAAEIPLAPPPPEALSGPAHAQDLFFNPTEAARSRAELAREHGGLSAYKLLIDQLEVRFGDGREGYSWDAQFWYGGDTDKLWVKAEGEGAFGEAFDGAEIQALWSRAIDPWFDLQAGVRQDIGAGPDRTHLVIGIQGLAPYWFEVEAAAFLSTAGDITARFEAEYDLRLTQRLILQPHLEVDLSLQEVPELGLGSGVTTAELGVRLRHEYFPGGGPAVVAPYLGVSYEHAFGRTRAFRRTAGEETGGLRFLVGVRTWF